MYKYYLSISGVRILLETEHPIVENPEFRPFLLEETDTDIRACFYGCKQLSSKAMQIIFADKCYQIALNEDGNLMKLFYETPDDPVCYAVSIYDSASGHIKVEYLESYERCVNELQNCFYLLGFEQVLLEREKLCLHATCVETHLGGILFSGVSGIGKSTQADLWYRYRGAKHINGDRPILSKEKDEWVAWGSPYAGSSRHHVNEKCKITAIILLKQAEDCAVHRLTPAEAFRGVWAGLTVRIWDEFFVEKASSLTTDLITKIPILEFNCTPDEKAVDYLEEILRKEIRL